MNLCVKPALTMRRILDELPLRVLWRKLAAASSEERYMAHVLRDKFVLISAVPASRDVRAS
jgi:hypothetical protein